MRGWVFLALAASGCLIYRDTVTVTEGGAEVDGTWTSTPGTTPTEPDRAPGQLSVCWEVDGGCDAAGVDTVEVAFDGVLGVFPCRDGAATVEARRGTHPLVLTGRDAAGIARYQAEERHVEVNRGALTEVPSLPLLPLPSDVVVTWYFANGRLCSSNDVEDVEVTLYAADVWVDSAVRACDAGEVAFSELPPGVYAALALGTDRHGDVLDRGESGFALLPGDSAAVDVALGEP